MPRTVVLALFLIASVAAAQGPALPDLGAYERILLPLAPNQRPGAFDTVWESFLTIHNSSETPVEVFHSPFHFFCVGIIIHCVPGSPMLPGSLVTTLDPLNFNEPILIPIVSADPGPGAFLYVDKRFAHEVFINTKVRELNTWGELNLGTEIPVIREQEMLAGRSELLNISIGSTARGLLRLYATADSPDVVPRVRVAVYGMLSGELLMEGMIDLASGRPSALLYPHYAELTLEGAADSVDSNAYWLRVAIEPQSDGFKYWAFASVTNNSTQLISITTPQ